MKIDRLYEIFKTNLLTEDFITQHNKNKVDIITPLVVFKLDNTYEDIFNTKEEKELIQELLDEYNIQQIEAKEREKAKSKERYCINRETRNKYSKAYYHKTKRNKLVLKKEKEQRAMEYLAIVEQKRGK